MLMNMAGSERTGSSRSIDSDQPHGFIKCSQFMVICPGGSTISDTGKTTL